MKNELIMIIAFKLLLSKVIVSEIFRSVIELYFFKKINFLFYFKLF